VPGRSRRLALVALLILFATGVALATPVPVVLVGHSSRSLLGRLDDGEALTYSYRQSIYDVPVYEDFVRAGDRIELRQVRSPDIRSVEYFRWDGDIVQDAQGLWTETAPRSEHEELVIRLTPLGQQRITTPRWTLDLLAEFGDAVVTLRVDRVPRGLVIARGAR
jgi:hypothetical protein